MIKKKRSVRQILNIGEIVDLDGYGTWATVESWDESSDIYLVTIERTGEEHEYIYVNDKSAPTYGKMKDEKRWADAYSTMAEAQDEYDSVHDPDYVGGNDEITID